MTTWLIDKSALVRLAASPDAAEWAARIERGLVRITTVTRLETGYSARSGTELRTALRQPPLSALPVEYLTPAIEDRAVEILTRLADQGKHRAPSIPDLIIAATAELAGLTVLHLDKDFDLIAEITGQPIERLNLCDIDREFCERGLAERRRNLVASVSRLLVSPNGIAHFPGCPHKGDHQDYRRWADLETARAWERLGNGEQMQATDGLRPDLTQCHSA